MTSIILTAEVDTLVVDAARLMAAEDISSLIVTNADVLAGIVTRREIISAQLLSEESYHTLTIEDIMITPVVTVSPDADIGQVISVMNKTMSRHVPVIEGDNVIGIVTATDVIRVLAAVKLIADGAPITDNDD